MKIDYYKRNKEKMLIYVALSLITLVMFFPIIWSLSQSLKTLSLFFEYPFKFIPKPVAWRNYTEAWEFGIGKWFKNSAIISVISTIICVFFSTLTGYTFAKFEFRFKNIYFIFILATMMIPWQLVIIPLYEVLIITKLVNTYTGLILPLTLSAFGIFLMRQFISAIPDELIQAARIDGASEIGIFFRIVIPLSGSAIATLSIFTFLGVWDEFYWPLIAGTASAVKVLPVGLTGFVTSQTVHYHLQMAGAVVSMLPVLIIFLFLQKYIIKAFMVSGIK